MTFSSRTETARTRRKKRPPSGRPWPWVLLCSSVWSFSAGWTAPQLTAEYYGGYITEKALSVDNLFVFLIIIASFKVPRRDQQKVLLIDIVFTDRPCRLHLHRRRGHLAFSWVFYLFGLILIYRRQAHRAKSRIRNRMKRTTLSLRRRFYSHPDYYDRDKLFTMEN